MGDERISNIGGWVRARLAYDGRHGERVLERMRHILWSTGIAVILFAALLLEPIDQTIWPIQTKFSDRAPSGDIVFVGSERALNDPSDPDRRKELALALRELDRRGVGKVYLHIPFSLSEDSAADDVLSEAIADLGFRIALVDRISLDPNERTVIKATHPSIGGNASRVVDDETDQQLFGLSWKDRFTHRIYDDDIRSFGSALGGVDKQNSEEFAIDYGFAADRIPFVSFSKLTRGSQTSEAGPFDFSGKTVVIGHEASVSGERHAIPGRQDAPTSYVAIFAGETLKSGRTIFISGLYLLLATTLGLTLVVMASSSRKRRNFGYGLVTLGLSILMIGTSVWGGRLEVSYTLAMLTIYALLRSRSRWRRRVQLINQETGLPTLRALENRLLMGAVANGHIVVAKVQNYERVLKSLPTHDRRQYVLKLVDRLRATDPGLAVYCEGHNIAWHTPNDETDAVVEHLEGLRAIFAAPVQVNDYSIDVGITFGVCALGDDISDRVTSAIAAAEETTEATCPIAVAEAGSQHELLWDISLRARIDEAMEAGEIYCVYQPKIDLQTREMVGVEALVRWHDPTRGFISPVHFIHQCEKAGRMEHLTRYVLQCACSAAHLLHFRGAPIGMSVNISATLLGDMRVVGIVRNVLQATKFDPNSLTLEITETARIADLSTAATILTELKQMGVRISIDDFGVGAANFETFYELPFDELKIDRIFVADVRKNEKARTIVESMALIGANSRITIVAEGLENLADAQILKDLGCQQVQGYAFSRPISLSNLLDFKRTSPGDAVANVV